MVFSIALVDAKHERAKAWLSVDHHADGVPTVGTIPCLVTADKPLRSQGLRRSTAFGSVVDGGHVRLAVALADGRGEVVQPCDLLDAQLK